MQEVIEKKINSNLTKLTYFFTFYCHKISTTEEVLNFVVGDGHESFYNLMGKFIFNKRIDPVTKQVRKMTKIEMQVKPIPKRYYEIQDVIDNCLKHTDKNHINNYLISQGSKRFKDLKEIATFYETLSYTDCIDKFEHRGSHTFDPFRLEDTKLIINVLSYTTHNKSQYLNNEGDDELKKEEYAFNTKNEMKEKRIVLDPKHKELYTKINPSLAAFNKKSFKFEIYDQFHKVYSQKWEKKWSSAVIKTKAKAKTIDFDRSDEDEDEDQKACDLLITHNADYLIKLLGEK